MINTPRRRPQAPDPAQSDKCATGSAVAPTARLAQPAERKALNLVVVGSSPTVGAFRPHACAHTHTHTHTHARRNTQCDPGRTRTCNLWFRRPTPYPLGHRAGRGIIVTCKVRALLLRRSHSLNPTRESSAHCKRPTSCNDIRNGSHSSAG